MERFDDQADFSDSDASLMSALANSLGNDVLQHLQRRSIEDLQVAPLGERPGIGQSVLREELATYIAEGRYYERQCPPTPSTRMMVPPPTIHMLHNANFTIQRAMAGVLLMVGRDPGHSGLLPLQPQQASTCADRSVRRAHGSYTGSRSRFHEFIVDSVRWSGRNTQQHLGGPWHRVVRFELQDPYEFESHVVKRLEARRFVEDAWRSGQWLVQSFWELQDAAGWPNDIAVTQYLGPPEMEEVQHVLFEKWVKLVMR